MLSLGLSGVNVSMFIKVEQEIIKIIYITFIEILEIHIGKVK